MDYKPKLIEVALPLAAINAEAAREKSVRHGHPSTLHLWWARRPLAAARAVIWAALVDDPSGDPSLTPDEQDTERQRLFGILERLVKWENSNNVDVLAEARAGDRPVLPGRATVDLGPLRRGRGHTAGGRAARSHARARGRRRAAMPLGSARRASMTRRAASARRALSSWPSMAVARLATCANSTPRAFRP